MVDFSDHTTTAGYRTGQVRVRLASDARQGLLLPVPLDALQLALQPAQAGGGVVVLVAGVAQVLTDHVEGVAELLEVAPQAAQTGLDLLGITLDPEAAHAHHDHAPVG